MDRHIKVINALEIEHNLTTKDLAYLISDNRTEIIPSILGAADRVRSKYVGNEVHLRGLIEFSNYCHNSCQYCGLRGSNKSIERYRMSASDIVETAEKAANLGLKTIVLQSGEDKFYSVEVLCSVIEEIKKLDVAVTLSIGELATEDYANLKTAGADRFLLRIETTEPELYKRLHPGMSIENRKRCLYDLKALGYEVGTGCLAGLPGQTPLMLAKDLKFFKELDADMIGIGPFIPCPGTPLENETGGSVQLALKMIALTRLMLPGINIPATTALAAKDEEGYKKGLECGANVIMPNMGKNEYRELYKIYPGKGSAEVNVKTCLDAIKELIVKEGRIVGKGEGNRQGFNLTKRQS
ncbi:MAG TPA: [FeFe] hydrogenase H-cluster radical SAM maturase HydE [Clostridiales bacterium]|nr:[FeFe] hydrogenase H-cluster radical SAM maturase HydE [Clostridiales bacterium]